MNFKQISLNNHTDIILPLLLLFALFRVFTFLPGICAASRFPRPEHASLVHATSKADTSILPAGEFIKMMEEKTSQMGTRPYLEGNSPKDLLTARFADSLRITTHFSEFIDLTEKKGFPGFDEENTIFTKVEVEASYPGEPSAYMRFLNKEFKYPPEAQKKNIQGTVVVQFLVDRNGNLSDIQVVGGPSNGGLREEAIRLIKASGKWLPAIQNGNIVASYKKRPFIFRIDTE